MKLDYQIRNFLAAQSFKTEADWEMISIFSARYGCKLSVQPSFNNDGLDVQTFISWFNDGFACGEVVKMGDDIVMLGECGLKNARIVAKEDAGKVFAVDMITDTCRLEKVSQNVSNGFFDILTGSNLHFDRVEQVVKRKYVPSINERVFFTDGLINGLGVVRTFDVESGYVELYCYYVYETKAIGFSMHEEGICNVRDFDYRPMTIPEQRRLNTELERHGKRWYDRLHRIEPLEMKAEIGGDYWYITDKMKVVKEREKGTPTSQFRYIAGNYFTSQKEADDCMGRFAEILRERLAEPEKK